MRCTATAASTGTRCRKPALRGEFYCAMHTPEVVDARTGQHRHDWRGVGWLPLEANQVVAEVLCRDCDRLDWWYLDPAGVSGIRVQQALAGRPMPEPRQYRPVTGEAP